MAQNLTEAGRRGQVAVLRPPDGRCRFADLTPLLTSIARPLKMVLYCE
jgi:hypothetical protein